MRSLLPLALCALLGASCVPAREAVRPEETKQTRPGATALVLVYSRSGNTAKMAQGFARELSADYLRVQGGPEVPDSYLGIPDWLAEVTVSPEKVDLSPYSLVLVGGPIWRWHPNAVTTTVIRRNDFTGKKVVLFYSFQGGKMEPATEEAWKKLVADRGGEVVDVVGIDRTALQGRTIEEEAARLAAEKRARWAP